MNGGRTEQPDVSSRRVRSSALGRKRRDWEGGLCVSTTLVMAKLPTRLYTTISHAFHSNVLHIVSVVIALQCALHVGELVSA